ncbi:MAG TPA: CapA family protein [Vicinamibacterales bacterium]|jgi:poly-gamma-glutamate synthesis protein (capsule biosynthesis protein)|nr:CapA family protein [Vicinamibacterales bacterium]
MRFRVSLVLALITVYAGALRLTGQAPAGPGAGPGIQGAPSSARNWTQDAAMKIMEPFALASVGDVIIVRPASQLNDAGLQSALKVIRDADVGFGNFESLIRDENSFQGPLGGSMVGTKEVAADLKAMGFKLMNRAGNHLMDSGQEGLFETVRLMDQAGLVYAGVGRSLDEARAPRFVETPKGRIGLVGMYSETGGNQSRLAATYRVGVTGGRPGLNALNLTRAISVSPDHLALLKRVKDAVYEHRTEYSNPVRPPAAESTGAVDFFGTTYKAGRTPGELTYAMNPRDLQDTLKSIKNGKEYSDFMIATIHAHQGDSVLQSFLFEDHPPDFLVELAHASIDSGADAFVGHGPHILRGIEIYKGKPIFYDLGEFFREWDWSCDCNVSPNGDVTQAESVVRGLEARGVVEPINYESAIALSRFDKGQLQEVRVYPIWARHDGPLSRRGLPMTAPPEIAQRILRRLQKLSEPFGTKIAIEGNVGVIRPGAGVSSSVP